MRQKSCDNCVPEFANYIPTRNAISHRPSLPPAPFPNAHAHSEKPAGPARLSECTARIAVCSLCGNELGCKETCYEVCCGHRSSILFLAASSWYVLCWLYWRAAFDLLNALFYTITVLLTLTTVRTITTCSACLIMTCVMGQMTAITDVTRRTAVTFASCVCTSTCEVKRGNFRGKIFDGANSVL